MGSYEAICCFLHRVSLIRHVICCFLHDVSSICTTIYHSLNDMYFFQLCLVDIPDTPVNCLLNKNLIIKKMNLYLNKDNTLPSIYPVKYKQYIASGPSCINIIWGGRPCDHIWFPGGGGLAQHPVPGRGEKFI